MYDPLWIFLTLRATNSDMVPVSRFVIDWIRGLDVLLLVSTLLLCVMGFAALYSIGLGKEDATDFSLLMRQLIAFAIGCSIIIVLSLIHYIRLRSGSIFIYACSLVALLIVLFAGQEIRGTRGWFEFGLFSFQPVEYAKIGLIFMLAWYFSSNSRQIDRLIHVVASAIIAVVPIGLVLLQPDLGSALVLIIIWIGMLLMSGIPKRYTISIALLIVLAMLAGWFFVFKDYQRERILTFLLPSQESQGRSYNIRQAQIAIGSGKLLGAGLGFGSQSHLKFLPESQTDFIFSVIAEELGFVGVAGILLCWLLFFQRAAALMKKIRDDFGLYLVLGSFFFFLSHVVINIGGNLGLLPLTGIVLPFMSYGGSALVISLLAVGLIQSVYAHAS